MAHEATRDDVPQARSRSYIVRVALKCSLSHGREVVTGTSCFVSLCFVDVKIGQDMNRRSLVFDLFVFTVNQVFIYSCSLGLSNVNSELGGTEVHDVFPKCFFPKKNVVQFLSLNILDQLLL